MSIVANLINNLPEITMPEANIASDLNYVKRSSTLVHEALQKGSDIMQMPNGDIMVTETQIKTYKYCWNSQKGRFERVTTGSKVKKRGDSNM